MACIGDGAKNGFAKREIGKLGQLVLSVKSKPGGREESHTAEAVS